MIAYFIYQSKIAIFVKVLLNIGGGIILKTLNIKGLRPGLEVSVFEDGKLIDRASVVSLTSSKSLYEVFMRTSGRDRPVTAITGKNSPHLMVLKISSIDLHKDGENQFVKLPRYIGWRILGYHPITCQGGWFSRYGRVYQFAAASPKQSK